MSTNTLDGVHELRGSMVVPREGTQVRRRKAKAASRRKVARRTIIGFIVFAVASAAMYAVFFGSLDVLMPKLTAGTFAGTGSVIALALVFSLVYGTFANYLLELLGIRALK